MSIAADQPDKRAGEAVHALLDAVSAGRAGSEAALLEVVYTELRAIAGAFFQVQRADHTLQPTALVHEAFVKLARGRETDWQNRAHFIAVAAKAMRQVLIDHARAKRTQKRSGPGQVTLSGLALEAGTDQIDAIDVHEKLERLARVDERQARIVEMRFFAGMTAKEISLVLGIGERTVELDWRMARAWLRRELEKGMA